MEPVLVCGCSQATRDDELRALLDAGAGEIFAGYVPERWAEQLGLEVSPNRRYEDDRQIGGPDRLRRVGDMVRARGARFSITLNEHLYPPAARALIPEIVDTALAAGATDFIVADLELCADLAATPGRRFGLIASCEAGIYSAASARAVLRHGADRIIFAREMRLPEMRAIAAEVRPGGAQLEAFIAREACVFSSAVCFVSHGYGHRTHFCCGHSHRSLVDTGCVTSLSNGPPAWSQKPAFLEAVSALNRCGLCALEPLLSMGVGFLKIPGRSDSALRALRLVARALAQADRSPAACRKLVGSDEFCATGNYCYYRLEDGEAKAPPAGTLAPAARALPADPPRAPPADQAGPRPAAGAPRLSVYLASGTFERRTLARLQARGIGALVERAPFFDDWERKAALRSLAVLEALGVARDVRPSEIHLGIELCALRLPLPRRLRAAAAAAREQGFAVSLVAPVAYQAAFAPLCAAIEEVLRDGDDGLTLVVNDVGLLEHAARTWPVRLATGRLFNRMKRDVYSSDPSVRPSRDRPGLRQAQAEANGHPYLEHDFWQELLRKNGVTRIGSDVLAAPLSARLSGGLAHSAYLPWAYVTGGRSCALAAAVEGTEVSYPTLRCHRPCNKTCIVPDYAWKTRAIVQRGQSVFMDMSEEALAFVRSASPGFDLLVYEPRVPY